MTLKKPPIHPPIEAGESPLFYLKRLALLNHYDSHTWLYKNAEDRVSRNLSQLVDYLTEEDWTKQAEQDEAALRPLLRRGPRFPQRYRDGGQGAGIF